MNKFMSTALLLASLSLMQGCNLDDLKGLFDEEKKGEEKELESKFMPPEIPVGLDSRYLPPAIMVLK